VNAAEPVLRGEPTHVDLVGVLLDISGRRGLDPATRSGAVAAIGASADEAVVPLLVGALADPELAVSAAAARALLKRDVERYRPAVAPVAAAWHAEEFPPYDVHEIRRMLEGE
jgi:HEAT repeat protein